MIDFSSASKETKELFEDVSDLNFLFLQLQLQYRVDLQERKSVIIFDEVQLCPSARQAIKSLVANHRYDYIETDNFRKVDEIKRDILNLYESDFAKIDPTGRLAMLFDAIPAQLNKNASRYQTSSVLNGEKQDKILEG